jgi:hypothetical protein
MVFDPKGPHKVVNVDLDGTLTCGELFWETRPTVNAGARKLVQELYEAGNVIIIWTARAWAYAPETVGWLIENRVPFHAISMQKGGSDLYIDDKALRYTTADRVRPELVKGGFLTDPIPF